MANPRQGFPSGERASPTTVLQDLWRGSRGVGGVWRGSGTHQPRGWGPGLARRFEDTVRTPGSQREGAGTR